MTAAVIILEAIRIVQRPVVEGLPQSFCVEYFGNCEAGQFIICRPNEDWDYKSFFCFLKRDGKWTDNPISKVVRYRDGGTTEVETKAGMFFFPTPFEKEKYPTFNAERIALYNDSDATRDLM